MQVWLNYPSLQNNHYLESKYHVFLSGNVIPNMNSNENTLTSLNAKIVSQKSLYKCEMLIKGILCYLLISN